MKCNNCGANVPYKAEKCNYCNKLTGYKSDVSVSCHTVLRGLTSDAYGEKITFLGFDRVKAKKREKYIKTLKEYKEVSHKNKKAQIPKIVAAIILVMIIMLVSVSIPLMNEKAAANDFVRIATMIILAIIAVVLILLRKPFRKIEQETKKETNFFNVHNQKVLYYFTSNVFGYVNADERYYIGGVARFKYKWGVYEFNKQDIESITYDAYYQEYVVHLKRAVYHNSYEEEPSCDIRIADIFGEKTLLDIALNKNTVLF